MIKKVWENARAKQVRDVLNGEEDAAQSVPGPNRDFFQFVERERDVVGEAALVGRLLDGGADINHRSRRFGRPLVMLAREARTSKEYLRTVFNSVVAHARPDLTTYIDRRRVDTVGQSLARNMGGFMRDDVVAYAASTGQDIDNPI